MPDLEHAGCILFWGYNPSLARLAHATATVAALKRGARLIVVDPRRAGLANKADLWLRVRPGTDGALALGIANVMIERGWYDRDFVRDWTNGPLLVRADTGRLLTEARPLAGTGSAQRVRRLGRGAAVAPLLYDPATGRYEREQRRAGPLRRVHDRHAAGQGRLPARVRPRRRALPALSAGAGRGDLLASAATRSRRRPGCSGRRGRSPTTPGAASSSRRTPPRSPAPSRCSTR